MEEGRKLSQCRYSKRIIDMIVLNVPVFISCCLWWVWMYLVVKKKITGCIYYTNQLTMNESLPKGNITWKHIKLSVTYWLWYSHIVKIELQQYSRTYQSGVGVTFWLNSWQPRLTNACGVIHVVSNNPWLFVVVTYAQIFSNILLSRYWVHQKPIFWGQM